jgi:uncharacterized membrane protein YeaQ/YmgE (transglycosylase-associated protein family)
MWLLISDLMARLVLFFLAGMVAEGRRCGQLLQMELGVLGAFLERNTWWPL